MIFFLLALTIFDNENQWSNKIASKMGDCEREVKMPDGTRADIVDYKNSITYEVDWDDKFYEGVGQSLYYSMEYSKFSGKKFNPGLILLIKDPKDLKFAFRASKLCTRLKINIVLVDTINNVTYTSEGKQ